MLIDQLLDAYGVPNVGATDERVRHVLESRKGLLLLAAEVAYQMERAKKIEDELLKIEARMTDVRNALTRAGIGETVRIEGVERWMTESARVDMLVAREKSLLASEGDRAKTKPTEAATTPTNEEVNKWRHLYVKALYGEQQADRLAEPHQANCQGCSHPVHCLEAGFGFAPVLQKVNSLLVERKLGILKGDTQHMETLLQSVLQAIWERPREEWTQALIMLAVLALENLQQMEPCNG